MFRTLIAITAFISLLASAGVALTVDVRSVDNGYMYTGSNHDDRNTNIFVGNNDTYRNYVLFGTDRLTRRGLEVVGASLFFLSNNGQYRSATPNDTDLV
ncbi:MAG: hypothetical protein AAF727_01150 [Pseudomonadota bacterium]